MKINQLKAGVILSYGYQAVHVLTSLIYTPIMLRLLGQSEYGLYQLVSSVISYLSLLSLGFGSGYIRFYSRYKVNDDKEGIARLNGMFLIIFAVISVICMLCGVALIFNAKAVFGDGLTTAELGKAKILMAMLVFNMSITFINSVFASNIVAHEKFFFQKIIELLRAIFSPFLTLPLLFLGYGSIAMVGVTSFLTILAVSTNICYCFKKLKIKFYFKHFDFRLLKELWAFTFFIFINIVVDQINWNVDKFLLGRMIGTVAVSVYGVASQLNSMYMIMSTSISSVFIPRVNMIVSKGMGREALTNLLIRIGKIQAVVLGGVILAYIGFGKEFVLLWAGNGYEDAYYIGLLLMLPETPALTYNIAIEIRRAKNKHKIPALIMCLVSIFNVFISIPLIKIYGGIGAAAGTAICMIANVIFINFYYHLCCELNMIAFWKKMFTTYITFAVMGFLGCVICRSISINSYIDLAIVGSIYLMVYFAVAFFVIIDKETRHGICAKVNVIMKGQKQ